MQVLLRRVLSGLWAIVRLVLHLFNRLFAELRRRYGPIGAVVILMSSSAFVLLLLMTIANGSVPRPIAATTPATTQASGATKVPQATQVPTVLPVVPEPTPVPARTAVPPGFMSRTEFGEDWPLTVESGTVACLRPSIVVFYAEGVTYAINGVAQSTDEYADIRPIWRDHPIVEGLKVSIAPILERGLALCE